MLTDAKSASHLSHNHFAGGDSAFSIVLNGIIDDDTVKNQLSTGIGPIGPSGGMSTD
jgi:hypothetical protein